MTEFDPIAWLDAAAHPHPDLVGALLADSIDDELIARDVRDHLTRCAHCRAIAASLDWMPPVASGVVIAGPWPANGSGRGQHEDVPLRMAAATPSRPRKVGDQGGPSSSPAFVAVVPTSDGRATLGYVRGPADVVLVAGADGGGHLRLGARDFALGEPDAAGRRVVQGLTQEMLTIWMVDAEARDDPGPEVV